MLLFLAWTSLSFFFGVAWIVLSYVSNSELPVEYMMFYRLMIAALFVLVILLVRRQRILIRKTEILTCIIIALGQLNVSLSGYGTKYLLSGLIACVTITQLFISEVLDAILAKRFPRRKIIISGIIGFVGLVMLCNQELMTMDKITVDTLIGIAFSFASTVVVVIRNVVYEKANADVKSMPRMTFLFYHFFFAAIIFLVLGFILHPHASLVSASVFNLKYMLAVAWLAITASVIALLATYYIIEKQGAVKSSYINFIMPIIAMVISTLMEGYRWNLMAFAGMVLLIYSTWIGIREHQIEIGERA